MDPLGIALENFDVIGRWRDQYRDVGNYGITKGNGGDEARFPVDSKTVHNDGRAFEGLAGLKEILLSDHEEFSRVFVKNLLSYALARQLTFRDRESQALLHNQAAAADYKLRDIMLTIVASEFFVRR